MNNNENIANGLKRQKYLEKDKNSTYTATLEAQKMQQIVEQFTNPGISPEKGQDTAEDETKKKVTFNNRIKRRNFSYPNIDDNKGNNIDDLFQTYDEHKEARRDAREDRLSRPQDPLLKSAKKIIKGYKNRVIGTTGVGIEPEPLETSSQRIIDYDNYTKAVITRSEANKYFRNSNDGEIDKEKQAQNKFDSDNKIKAENSSINNSDDLKTVKRIHSEAASLIATVKALNINTEEAIQKARDTNNSSQGAQTDNTTASAVKAMAESLAARNNNKGPEVSKYPSKGGFAKMVIDQQNNNNTYDSRSLVK